MSHVPVWIPLFLIFCILAGAWFFGDTVPGGSQDTPESLPTASNVEFEEGKADR